MKIIKQHEKFEIETLDIMRSLKSLEKLIFGGGTMLRLCFNLSRYSVNLDFYVAKGKSYKKDFKALKKGLESYRYEVTDFQEKYFTYLIELRREGFPRRLKIEIRKQRGAELKTTTGIAFSQSAPTLQVRLTTCTLEQMWANKVGALLDRSEIRDAYDLEFLLRRGAGSFDGLKKSDISKLLEIVGGFTDADYKNKLGNLLSQDDRKFCLENRFTFLKAELNSASSAA